MGKKYVPVHRHSIWYYFGVTLFLFIIQVVTGSCSSLLQGERGPRLRKHPVHHVEGAVGWLIRSIQLGGEPLHPGGVDPWAFSVYFERPIASRARSPPLTGMLMLFLGFASIQRVPAPRTSGVLRHQGGYRHRGRGAVHRRADPEFLRSGPDVTGRDAFEVLRLHVALFPGIFTVLPASTGPRPAAGDERADGPRRDNNADEEDALLPELPLPGPPLAHRAEPAGDPGGVLPRSRDRRPTPSPPRRPASNRNGTSCSCSRRLNIFRRISGYSRGNGRYPRLQPRRLASGCSSRSGTGAARVWQKSKLVTYCGVFALMFIIVTTIVGWLAWKTRMILTAGRCSGVDGCARSQTADALLPAAATKPDNCLVPPGREAAGVKYAADVHYKKAYPAPGATAATRRPTIRNRRCLPKRDFGVPEG